jgi:hypothetical protein
MAALIIILTGNNTASCISEAPYCPMNNIEDGHIYINQFGYAYSPSMCNLQPAINNIGAITLIHEITTILLTIRDILNA